MNAAAAIYVLSEEDIQRSGALSIAEALRMVPGLNVAQVNANKWAISSRGFNNRFANKLLVLRDGRSVYTPIFSGVYWDTQDTLLEDLAQIEVIRGPGGALWGANAVNGVINITTKPAWETQGLLVTAIGGSEMNEAGAVRYGGALATNLHYRVYAKAHNHSDFLQLGGGAEAADEWWQQREGFRLDWRPGAEHLLTFQGDYYYGHSGDRLLLATPAPPFATPVFERAEATGWNVIGRWTHTVSEFSQYTLQTYLDGSERRSSYLDAEVLTYDLDFQHRLEIGSRNEFVWGAGYRLISDEVVGSYSVTYLPPGAEDQLWSLFLQDKLEIAPERLWLTAGAKLEHNDYTGLEVQPSARLSFKPADRQTLWAAVSRAVRTPARYEGGSMALTPVPGAGGLLARSGPQAGGVDSEKLIAYELGYRVEPFAALFLDIALFYNDYEDLRSTERGAIIRGGAGEPDILPLTWANNTVGETYGFEIAPTWRPVEGWRLSAGYSLLKVNLHRTAPGPDPTNLGIEGDSPQQQFQLRSFIDLPHNVQFDTAVYYVDELPNQRLTGASTVGDYTRLDVRLGWQPTSQLELSLVFQNLLDPQHPEFGGTSPLVTPTEIQRSVYGKVTWRF